MYGLFYTHVGKEEYWGLSLASKVDLKYWKPASIAKEGLACDLGLCEEPGVLPEKVLPVLWRFRKSWFFRRLSWLGYGGVLRLGTVSGWI